MPPNFSILSFAELEIKLTSASNFSFINIILSSVEALSTTIISWLDPVCSYNDFRQLRKYAIHAKDYFYEASDLEQEENLDTKKMQG